MPAGFFGATVDGPMLEPGFPLDPELGVMVRSGVETARVAVYWDVAQPYASAADVPAAQAARFRNEGGVPTDWGPTDRLVASLAARGFRVLPTVLRAPAWGARHPGRFNSPPSGTGPFARFAGALVRRYGPEGAFWRERPDVPRRPLRDWQIWNEPNQPVFYWSDQPFARDYVALLRAARAQIKAADPRARVVLAGLVGESWTGLQRVYDAGGRGLFEVAAVHPFTLRPRNVVRILELFRATLDRNGARKVPMLATEVSWPSAKGKVTRTYGYEVSERDQARNLAALLPRMVAARRTLRLEGAYWYTWLSYDRRGNDPFSFSGLRRWTGSAAQDKPAYSTWRKLTRRYEGCSKRTLASRCN